MILFIYFRGFVAEKRKREDQPYASESGNGAANGDANVRLHVYILNVFIYLFIVKRIGQV